MGWEEVDNILLRTAQVLYREEEKPGRRAAYSTFLLRQRTVH